MNQNLKNLLDDQGIDPAPKKHALDNAFDSPLDQLEDLFGLFGRIFSPYEKKNDIKPKGWRKDQIDKEKRDEL